MLQTGMLQAGKGATHADTLLTSTHLPAAHQNTLRARERERGSVFEKI